MNRGRYSCWSWQLVWREVALWHLVVLLVALVWSIVLQLFLSESAHVMWILLFISSSDVFIVVFKIIQHILFRVQMNWGGKWILLLLSNKLNLLVFHHQFPLQLSNHHLLLHWIEYYFLSWLPHVLHLAVNIRWWRPSDIDLWLCSIRLKEALVWLGNRSLKNGFLFLFFKFLEESLVSYNRMFFVLSFFSVLIFGFL